MQDNDEPEALIVKPRITLLQVEDMVNDQRDYVRAENCSMETQMKLDSFVHDIQRERMARSTIVPTLHQFFSRKGEYKDTTDDMQMVQV